MKNLICILVVLILFGCENSEEKDTADNSDRMELVPEPDKELREEYETSIKKVAEQSDSITCSAKAIDFIKLKNKNLQTEFFAKLDSIRKVQYPDNDQVASIMVDLTPKYLNKFLADVDQDSLKMKESFEKDYHFNIAPKDYTDPEICKDKIEITFDEKHCSFRLKIYNTFLVEHDWCTESMVVYVFKITDNGILDFWRNEAG